MPRAHKQFADLLDSTVLHVVQALNAYERAPQLKTIDTLRKSLEEHALAFAALGAAFPRVFSPGPTLEQLEESDLHRRDTSPELPHSKRPPAPPPPAGDGPPPLPRRK